MNDLINRQTAIDSFEIYAEMLRRVLDDTDIVGNDRDKFERGLGLIESFISDMKELSSAEPEIIRCKDCKFYIPMNRKTKTGICNLTMHQNFGYDWFCAGAEKRADMRGEHT